MSLPLTPDRVQSTYDCLRSFPPFCKWKLPEGKDVHQFRVTKHIGEQGHYTRYIGTDKHIIAVSSRNVGHFISLVQVVAHEMIHLKQGIDKTETPGTVHNADFRKKALNICKLFGWDFKTFV